MSTTDETRTSPSEQIQEPAPSEGPPASSPGPAQTPERSPVGQSGPPPSTPGRPPGMGIPPTSQPGRDGPGYPSAPPHAGPHYPAAPPFAAPPWGPPYPPEYGGLPAQEAPAEAPEVTPGDPDPPDVDTEELEDGVVAILRTCYDPEIPVNIYDLGLIYGIEVDEEQNVHVQMTLTSPMCPVAQTLPVEVQNKVATVRGVRSAKVEIVWDPPWNQEMMGEAAKLQLGLLW